MKKLIAAALIAFAATATIPSMSYAKQGADDGASHVRGGGADDGAGHLRGGGADDAAGDIRGGGADDAAGHVKGADHHQCFLNLAKC